MEAYAAYYNNINIRSNSSSGGIFSVLAMYIISKLGVVYGVAMSEDCYSAEFIRIIDEKQIDQIRGAKYLQAKVGSTFKNVRRDLNEGKLVLFTGTGCQINGLKCFLMHEYDNLICVDVICHGTPSPALWRQYIKHKEKKYGKIKTINFRCKDISWNEYGMKENQIFISADKDPYMQMFLRNLSLRPSCYECMAKKVKMSDITIADFWGVEKVAPDMDDHNGTSLVLVRTEKGRRLFEKVYGDLKVKMVSYKESIKQNPSEYQSAIKPIQRNTFFSDMKNMRFDELGKRYAAPIRIPIMNKIKRTIKRIIRINLRLAKSDY